MGIQGPSNRFSRKFKAVCVGNAVEYYEWVTFSAFADVFGREFFEQSRDTSEAENLLLGLSVFAAGFLMRPLGGIVFGYIGDRYSRERALELSVLCMVLPSTILIFLPTFKTAGIFASIALVVVRLLQGLACGGEMVGAFVHTMETAEGSPGLWGGLVKSTSSMGATLGLLAASTARANLSEEELYSWGWRLCFAGGSLLGLLGVYMRALVFAERERDEEEMLTMQMDVVVTQPNRIFSRRSSSSSNKSSDSTHSSSTGSTSSGIAGSRIAPGVTSPIMAAESYNADQASAVIDDLPVSAFATFDTTSSGFSTQSSLSPRDNAEAVSYSSAPLATVEEVEQEQEQVQEEVLDKPAHFSPTQQHNLADYRPMASLSGVSGSSNVQAARAKELPLSLVLSELKFELAVGFLFLSFWCVGYYTCFVWHGYYLTSEEMLGAAPLSESQGWWLIFFSNASLILLLPLGGSLGDWSQRSYISQLDSAAAGHGSAVVTSSKTRGHRRVMMAACVFMGIVAPFAYMQMAEATLESCIIGQILLCVPVGIFGGNVCVCICDLFPQSARYTGVGLTYNTANAIVSGTAALVQTHLVLIGQLGSPEKDTPWTWETTFMASDMIMDSCEGNWWCRLMNGWDWACQVLSEVLDREFHDSRLFPAAYLQTIALLSVGALSFGLYRAHVRKQSANLRALQLQAEQVLVTPYPPGVPGTFPTIEYVQV